jgi:hypothetical protein
VRLTPINRERDTDPAVKQVHHVDRDRTAGGAADARLKQGRTGGDLPISRSALQVDDDSLHLFTDRSRRLPAPTRTVETY